MKINKVIVLGGGFSEEKDVSKVSSAKVAEALSQNIDNVTLLDPANYDSWDDLIKAIKNEKPDICFIGLHGGEGEDGRIQALLELNDISFTGSGFNACALAMDKEVSGLLAQSLDIPLPHRIILEELPDDLKAIGIKLGYPLVVKPNNSGSSVGISIVRKEDDLYDAVKEAFKYSKRVICEAFIEGRELTVTILDNRALSVVEIKPQDGWYDYTSKYTKGKTIYEVPAALSKDETRIIQNYARNIFKLLGCQIYGRVDFRFDGTNFYFLEVNTLPGMTPLSLTPMAAGEAGLNFSQLLLKIVELSQNKIKQ